MPNISLRPVAAAFETNRTVADCVERLTFRVDDFAVADTARQHERRMTGTIDGDRVSLRVVTPFTRNVFARHFNGHFEIREGKTVLVGRFAAEPWVSRSINAWIFLVGFSGIIFLADLAIGTQKLSTRIGMLAIYAIFVGLYAYVMNYSNKWSETDIALMREEIEAALG
jgi:hypothetical protein